MKRSFLVMALEHLAVSVVKVVTGSAQNAKFISLDLALELGELSSRFTWLRLTEEFKSILKLKFSGPQEKLFLELIELTKAYPELNGFDFAKGDPFQFVANARAKTAAELSENLGDKTEYVEVDAATRVCELVMQYNFFYKYQSKLSAEFKAVEQQMEAKARSERWAARGSWNSRVEKKDKPKKKTDFSFLSQFRKQQEVVVS